MTDIDDLLERISNARADADYHADEGETERAVVLLSLEDCDAFAELLSDAFGAVLMGKRDPALADKLTLLSGALKREED